MWLALIGGKQLIANRATANSQWSDGDDDDDEEEDNDDDDDDEDEDVDYEASHDDEIDWKHIWQIGFEKYQSVGTSDDDDDDVDGSDGSDGGYFRQIDFDKYQLERSSVAKRWESGWNETQL